MRTPLSSFALLAVLIIGCAGPEHGSHGDHHGRAAHSDHMHHDFSDAERWAKVFDDPARDEWQRPLEVVRVCDLRPGMVVADIGAGTGYFVPHLATAVGRTGEVLALDIEQSLIDHMSARFAAAEISNASARVIPTDDPGLAPGSVDRVLIVNTWHHIGARVEYSKKLARGLRPGGRVLVVDYTMDAPHGPPKRHRMPASAVIAELEAAGFTAREAETTLPYQYVVVGE